MTADELVVELDEAYSWLEDIREPGALMARRILESVGARIRLDTGAGPADRRAGLENMGAFRLTFGKHAGSTVADVARHDAGYLEWLAAQRWFRKGPALAAWLLVDRKGRQPQSRPPAESFPRIHAPVPNPTTVPPWEGPSCFHGGRVPDTE